MNVENLRTSSFRMKSSMTAHETIGKFDLTNISFNDFQTNGLKYADDISHPWKNALSYFSVRSVSVWFDLVF